LVDFLRAVKIMVKLGLFRERKMAGRLIVLTALVLLFDPAVAGPLAPVPGPSPDFDTGLIGFAMIAGAAFLARRRRRG
jgi:LPXTG-motif cell wall-anchored protein